MKNTTIVAATFMFAVFALSSCSTMTSCDKWRMGAYSRGEAENLFTPGSGKGIPSTKLTSECVVTIFNKTDKAVDVFIDTVWQGSLKSRSTGFIDVHDGDFKYMHAVTPDGQLGWSAKGGCNENKTFKISQ